MINNYSKFFYMIRILYLFLIIILLLDIWSNIFVAKLSALVLLVSNCVMELCIRIIEAKDAKEDVYGSQIFGPSCLLISLLLAFYMMIHEKVFILELHLWLTSTKISMHNNFMINQFFIWIISGSMYIHRQYCFHFGYSFLQPVFQLLNTKSSNW